MLSTFARFGIRQGIKINSCHQLKQCIISPACVQAFVTNQTIRCCSSKTIDKPEEVYYGALTSQIKMVKVFSLCSSVAGLIFQPILYRQLETLPALPVYGMIGVVGFFTFVTPVLLHFVTKKYVTHLTFDPKTETYTAETLSFFLQKKKISFKPEDVKVPDVPGMFTSMMVKGVPLFTDPRMYKNPDHYVKIMGYDKPIDFKLELTEENKKPDDKVKTENVTKK